ncbi:hypothetical protein B296_00058198 [Ensete ventricosum]|uniref:Bulb-type lectin domain-containing protein n=1 Tax=Ensete ventricosum TaxID=4639 RepID=A0A426XF34_ENSVE|nr:hypothetical protein B296_00058198 [Ensete ventricosum]
MGRRQREAYHRFLCQSYDLRCSNLVVVDAKGGLLWSSNLSGVGTPGSDAAAVLLDSGNLVLQADSISILWQSIDHPTDTILPGMKIQYNRSSHSAIYITSWKEAEDPSPGDYSLGVDLSTCLQCMIWWKSKPYWRSQVWAGSLFAAGGVPNSYSVSYVTVMADEGARQRRWQLQHLFLQQSFHWLVSSSHGGAVWY